MESCLCPHGRPTSKVAVSGSPTTPACSAASRLSLLSHHPYAQPRLEPPHPPLPDTGCVRRLHPRRARHRALPRLTAPVRMESTRHCSTCLSDRSTAPTRQPGASRPLLIRRGLRRGAPPRLSVSSRSQLHGQGVPRGLAPHRQRCVGRSHPPARASCKQRSGGGRTVLGRSGDRFMRPALAAATWGSRRIRGRWRRTKRQSRMRSVQRSWRSGQLPLHSPRGTEITDIVRLKWSNGSSASACLDPSVTYCSTELSTLSVLVNQLRINARSGALFGSLHLVVISISPSQKYYHNLKHGIHAN